MDIGGEVLSTGAIRPGPTVGMDIDVSPVAGVVSATTGAGWYARNELFGWCW
jgi:hypothetical protein